MFQRAFQITSFTSLFYLLTTSITSAQIIPNGLGTTVNLPNCTICTIEGGTTAGTNLFHSFEQFSIPTGGEAFFNNSSNIENIISRVTGGVISNLDGLLANNGNANFILINPSGIILGPNVSLNIGGSLMATTAESIIFADGTEFSAINNSPNSLLTVSVPIGLQFGPQGGGKIEVNPSYLELNSDQTLALIGGEVNLDKGAYIFINSGRVELGSVQGNSLVNITQTAPGWVLNYNNVTAFQDINLMGGSVIETSGNAGGEYQLQGRNINLLDGSALFVNTRSENGGTITVNASETITTEGLDRFGLPGGFFTQTSSNGTAGDIIINTGKLIVENGAQVSSLSTRSGNTGNIIVNATESIELMGVQIGSNDTEYISGLIARTTRDGNTGQIIVNTGNLTVKDGANVGTTSFGDGDSGDININAKSIFLTGESAFDTGASGIFANAINNGTGTAGSIKINSDTVVVENGAQINLGNFQSRGQTPPGLGSAGNLEINSPFILLNTGGTLTAEANAGNEGNIILNTADLRLRQGSLITTNARGTATGGNIIINTDTLVALENSDITANAIDNFGGRVSISSQGIFGTEFRLEPTPESDITATSALGPQFSGTVEINSPEADPNSGLVELPDNVVDVEGLIQQNACNLEGGGSSLVVTGRGGLPFSPNEPLSNEYNDIGWISVLESENPSINSSQTPEIQKSPVQLVQATSWIREADGTIVLVSPQAVTMNQISCQ
jgi:filamentous hemagglutinin family protein